MIKIVICILVCLCMHSKPCQFKYQISFQFLTFFFLKYLITSIMKYIHEWFLWFFSQQFHNGILSYSFFYILLINYINKSSKNHYARTSVRNESKLDEKNWFQITTLKLAHPYLLCIYLTFNTIITFNNKCKAKFDIKELNSLISFHKIFIIAFYVLDQ